MKSALAALLMMMRLGSSAGPHTAPANGICEILSRDPTRLNHTIVQLTGRLEGTDEGAWLAADCTTQLVTRGLVWGSKISVYRDPTNKDAALSWRAMLRRLKSLHYDPARDVVWLTVIGRLETRASMDDMVVQMPYGPTRAGFGHLGSSAAEIDVLSVEDVSVEKKPRP